MSSAEAQDLPDQLEDGEKVDETSETSYPKIDEVGFSANSSGALNAQGLLPHGTLKYSLLGPSLLKAGQESVDQDKVSEIIYEASKGSKYFDREEERDKNLTLKIDHILEKKAQLGQVDLTRDLRLVDVLISQLDDTRDLSQFIVHVDCDAFYAAVELLSRPELADVPFAVGGGVILTCNYVARKFGCRSGMAGFVAKKLCPQLVQLKPDFTKYCAKAQEIRLIFAEYDPRFESASIDEAYLNVTQYCATHGISPADAANKLRKEVAEKTSVTISAGIAANTRLAKICSNINKPNGQFVLANNRAAILEFMRTLPCRKVNGVGRVFERQLAALGINTCGDVWEHRMILSRLFGDKACHFLVQCYLGLGKTRVQPAEEYERKSVGTESTFSSMSNSSQLRQKLQQTAEELEKDLRRAACKGRTLVLKIKLNTFEIYTRQVVVPRPVCLASDLYSRALPMLTKLEQDIPNMTVRLIGLRCTHLVSSNRPDAFAFFGLKPPESHDMELSDRRVDRESDSIQNAGTEILPKVASKGDYLAAGQEAGTASPTADDEDKEERTHTGHRAQEEHAQRLALVTADARLHGKTITPILRSKGADLLVSQNEEEVSRDQG
ncbi:hypothetical protein SEPCBS57363_005517 [Sporothrix epigloea]|uniref:DNA polymerase kappa n=1 Tax=Sporothrix epigloea TaxID=1892477 RepID=A0ABP0DXZ4_9PEZI